MPSGSAPDRVNSSVWQMPVALISFTGLPGRDLVKTLTLSFFITCCHDAAPSAALCRAAPLVVDVAVNVEVEGAVEVEDAGGAAGSAARAVAPIASLTVALAPPAFECR